MRAIISTTCTRLSLQVIFPRSITTDMFRNFILMIAMCCAAICVLPVSNAQAVTNYDGASVDNENALDSLGWLYNVLGLHDSLDSHVLARKSVRSPSRRLRFGRRSDPNVPSQVDDMENLLSVREVRTPVRLRFGRRSEEHAVPHVFPQDQDRVVRAPSMRLRFGRRSDNNMFLMPYESTLPKEVKASSSVEDDRQQN